MKLVTQPELSLEDAKRYAEERAEREGIKMCVRRDSHKVGTPEYGKLFVVPAHDQGYAALGDLIYVSQNGYLR